MLSKTSENYLCVIYELSRDKGHARPKDLTDIFQVSSASVTEMLQKLGRQKLINYEKRGKITLTENGLAISSIMWTRRNTFRKLLEFAGVAPKKAHAEASRIKHNLSDDSVLKLLSLVERLEDCESLKSKSRKA